MIEINRFSNGFSATGHADFGEYGNDIVCAAVSAIIQTTIIGLINYGFKNFEYKKESGFILVNILKNTDAFDVLINTMFNGLNNIEYQYPDNIKINY